MLFEDQTDLEETRKRKDRGSVHESSSNNAKFVISVSDVAKPVGFNTCSWVLPQSMNNPQCTCEGYGSCSMHVSIFLLPRSSCYVPRLYVESRLLVAFELCGFH